MRNLKAGVKQLVPPREEEHPAGRDSSSRTDEDTALTWTWFIIEMVVISTVFLVDLQTGVPVSVSTFGGNQEVQLPARVPVNRSVEQPKPVSKEPLSEWKIPTLIHRQVSPEV